MKYYIIAGEASGDLHGANLMRGLKLYDPQATFRCWGGDHMVAAGGDLVKHYRNHAFMGFVEVIKNLGAIWQNIDYCCQDIVQYAPDVVILIDYSGFNLRIARFAKENGFTTCYYVAPQIWAWRQGRIKKIKKYLDKVFVILPFEIAFYQKHGYQAEYSGHPVLDALAQAPVKSRAEFLEAHQLPNRPTVALLPGSRKQEVLAKLPLMLSVISKFPDHQFVVAAVGALPGSLYESIMAPWPQARLVTDDTYSLLKASEAALVTSGTATLETALLGVPEVVCYKTGTVTYQILKRLISLPYISLVNLIMEKEVVKELIQDALTTPQLVHYLHELLYDPERKASILADYQQLREKLGGEGASVRNAEKLNRFLAEKKK
jgi:lipid-A-disaccharide synthase